MQISKNLLEPIITVFVANGERYNLLNSVVLEMFDFIRREGIKSLTAYFMDKLYSRVEEVDYDATFLKLKQRYEQSRDYVSTQSAAASSQLQSSRIRRDERALDRGQPLLNIHISCFTGKLWLLEEESSYCPISQTCPQKMFARLKQVRYWLS